jgi:hypothetical protein
MKRRILSVVSGSVAALLIIAGIEQLTPFFFDLPSHIAWNDKTALTAMVASMPLNAFLMILGGYILAAFTGGLIAGLIATENKTAAAIRVGFVLILGAIMHFVSIPHLVHHRFYRSIYSNGLSRRHPCIRDAPNRK